MEEKGPVKRVNRLQLHDLGITQEEEEQLREAEFATGADPVPSAPVYIPKLKKLKKKKTNHDYALRSLGHSCRCQGGFCRVAIYMRLQLKVPLSSNLWSVVNFHKKLLNGHPSNE